MILRGLAFGLAVLLLTGEGRREAQSAALLPPAMPTSVTIIDVNSGQGLSNSSLPVQLFPLEPGRFRVSNDKVQPTFASTVTTDSSASFSLTPPGGDHVIKIVIRQRPPVLDCVYIDTDESASHCGARLTQHQQFFVRVAASIPGFSGDIVGSSACAPYRPSPCDSLRVPNLVNRHRIVLVNSVRRAGNGRTDEDVD